MQRTEASSDRFEKKNHNSINFVIVIFFTFQYQCISLQLSLSRAKKRQRKNLIGNENRKIALLLNLKISCYERSIETSNRLAKVLQLIILNKKMKARRITR